MIKITLAEAYNSVQPLRKLSEKELPIKTAYTLGKLIRVIWDEVQYVETMRTKLATKYGKPNDKGGFDLDEENKEKFLEEWNELMAKTLEIDVEPWNDDLMNEISYVNMTPGDMAFLSVLMEGYKPRSRK